MGIHIHPTTAGNKIWEDWWYLPKGKMEQAMLEDRGTGQGQESENAKPRQINELNVHNELGSLWDESE